MVMINLKLPVIKLKKTYRILQ